MAEYVKHGVGSADRHLGTWLSRRPLRYLRLRMAWAEVGSAFWLLTFDEGFYKHPRMVPVRRLYLALGQGVVICLPIQ